MTRIGSTEKGHLEKDNFSIQDRAGPNVSFIQRSSNNCTISNARDQVSLFHALFSDTF